MAHPERSFPAVECELVEDDDVFDGSPVKLLKSHRRLQQQVTELNTELFRLYQERSEEFLEKDRVTQRLSSLLSALPAGVIVIDGGGMIQESNPAAQQLLNVTLQHQLWRDVIDTGFRPNSMAGCEAVLNSGRVVSISTCPLGTEPGQIVLLLDVTETRLLQGALERHKRLSAIGEVASKVAHQIRTPLASALLYVSNLVKSRVSEQDRMRFAEKALKRLKHLEKVVEDMLAVTRGGSATNKEVISLSNLITEINQMMAQPAIAAGCELRTSTLHDDVKLLANKDALLSSLQNLVNNAFQACGSDGVIEINTAIVVAHQGLPAVDIIVVDDGPGFSDQAKAHLFEPFFTTRSNGTGLGLSVVNSTIKTHGGSIWLDETVRQGARLIIRLPQHQS